MLFQTVSDAEVRTSLRKDMIHILNSTVAFSAMDDIQQTACILKIITVSFKRILIGLASNGETHMVGKCLSQYYQPFSLDFCRHNIDTRACG